MLDLRGTKTVNLSEAKVLKKDVAYLYTDISSGKKLVAKLFEHNPSNEEVMLGEFRKMAVLSAEPEISTAYFIADATIDGNHIKQCYVMDYVEGKTLEELTKSNKISLQDAISFTVELALGLEKAHSSGIFHNDLHEENIIIDNYGFLKIIDFSWFEFQAPAGDRHTADMNAFKKNIRKISDAISASDRKIFQPVLNLCYSAQNIRGLSKEILALEEILFDLSLLSDESLQLLANIIGPMPDEFDLSFGVNVSNAPIPIGWTLENAPELVVESKLSVINMAVARTFEFSFMELARTGLCSIASLVRSAGVFDTGSYVLSYTAYPSSKAANWARKNKKYNFLPAPKNITIHDFIFSKYSTIEQSKLVL